MRKHFLILMLMTLLPFTAWAVTPEDISTYEVVFGTYGSTFTPATITYNGGEQNFPNVVLKKDESTYVTSGFSATVWTYKGTTVTKITEAGEYTVTIQADGGQTATLTGNTTGKFIVGKAPITVKGKNITDGVTFGDALTASGAYFTKVGSKSFEATYTFPGGFNATTKTADENQFKAAQVFSTDYTQWADVTTASSKYKIIPVVANLNTTFTNYEFTAENGALTVKAKTLAKTWYDVAKDLKDHPYDASPYMPELTIKDPDRADDPATTNKDESKLVAGTDYTLTYYLANSEGKLVKATSSGSDPYTNDAGTDSNTKDVGKYFVVIAGKGNYASPEAGAYEEPYFIIKNVLGVSTKGGKSTYGQTPNLAGLLSFKGLAAGESFNNEATHSAGVLNENVSFVAVMTGKNQGTYPVTAKAIKTTPATSSSSSSASPAPAPTVTDVADNDVAKNYVPSYFNNGVWTIEKKPLEFKLKAQSITNGVASELSSAEGVQITATNFLDYFETIELAYDDEIATYPKVKLNDKDQIVVEGTFTFNNGEDEDSEDYADVTDNYDVKAIAPVAVTRKDGTLTIFVTDFTKNYGDDAEKLTVDVVGGTDKANADAKAAFEELLTVAKTGKAVNDAGVAQSADVTYPNAGIYNIVVGDYSKATLPAGYDIRVLNGTYTILKRELKSINPLAQTVATGSVVTDLEPASATTVKFVQKDGDAEKYPITDTDKRLLYEDIIAADATNHKGFAFKSSLTSVAAGKNSDGIEMVSLANKLRNFIALATGKADVYGAAVAAADVVLDRTITKDPTEDNVTKTVKTTIHSNKDKIANVKFGTRVLGSQKWNAFVLPFTISAADLSQAVGYAVFNVVDKANSDESHARFKLYMGIIEANTPFLMKTDKEIDMKDIPAIQGVQIVENLAPSVDVAGKIKFKGTYEQTLMKANNRWVVNDQWKEGTGKGGVLALTSYLEYPEGTNAPEIILEEVDGSTTAISAITADGEAVEATGWYTLNGIQLQGAPTEKGVYVRNGKKVVIK